MHVRVVTFRLAGISREAYLTHCEQIAARFTEWPGLIAKFWLDDPDRERVGGVYLFDSADAADASRDSELFRAMLANPAFADIVVEGFGTLAAPTAITAPEVLTRCGT